MGAITVDFTNVKESSGINTSRIPAGDYIATITGCNAGTKDGVPLWRFDITPDERKASCFPYYLKIQENQLWKLRGFLVALGVNVPKGKLKIDPNKLVGKAIGIEVEDDEWEGKERSTIVAVFKADDGITVTPGDNAADTGEVEDDEDDIDIDEL